MGRLSLGRCALGALVALALGACPAIAAQVTPSTLTAAFLYTFARFTEWPADANAAPLNICVLGDPAVAEGLDQVTSGRSLGGREILVSRVALGAGLRACHLLYVTGEDPAAATRALEAVGTAPVLTVGEGERFVRLGGIAGLFIEEGRMRFAINPEAALRAGLRLSSKILSLAKIVRDEHHGQS